MSEFEFELAVFCSAKWLLSSNTFVHCETHSGGDDEAK